MVSVEEKVLTELQRAIREGNQRDELIVAAVHLLKASFPKYDWVGVYLLEDGELVLHERFYRGANPAHKRIKLTEGICGAAARERQTVIVDDVNKDPRYLACSIATRSEIVLPIQRGSTLYGVLDIDSDHLAAFSDEDQRFLEQVSALLARVF